MDYRQVASDIAARYNIPANLFQALITHESAWNPRARSRAGAIGLGQLMPATARSLGVDPFDPVQNLEGAAKYLSSQYKAFGRWDLALAAYNAGPGAVQKYKGIPPYAETQAYVKGILADSPQEATGSPVTPSQPEPRVPPSPAQNAASPVSRADLVAAIQKASQTGDYTAFYGMLAKKRQWERQQAPPPPKGVNKKRWVQANALADAILGNAKFTVGGLPGQGTHDFRAGPNNWESDNAVDLMMAYGTPLYAAFDGTIGSQFGALGSSDPRMAGLRLHLMSPQDELYYAHLSRFAPGIRPGATVRKGQLIGYSGAANGANHLHLGDRTGSYISRYRRPKR